MGRELEFKYATNPDVLPAIRKKYQPFAKTEMATIYYDTADRAFSALHWTLRRRLENNRSVCALKTPREDGSRSEWETDCKSIGNALPELCKLGAPNELLVLAEPGLEELCSAKFTRHSAVLMLPKAEAELALDLGVLMGGGKILYFCEVEVELKSGSESAVRSFAEKLAEEFHLVPEPKSKAQRAMELLDM